MLSTEEQVFTMAKRKPRSNHALLFGMAIAGLLMPWLGMHIGLTALQTVLNKPSANDTFSVNIFAEALIALSGFIVGLVSSLAYRASEFGGVAIGVTAGLVWSFLLPKFDIGAFALVAGPTSVGWYAGTRVIAWWTGRRGRRNSATQQ